MLGRKKIEGEMNENKNPHRGSSFNEYKYECLMEDAKKLVEALKKSNQTLEQCYLLGCQIADDRQFDNERALEEFKANWELR